MSEKTPNDFNEVTETHEMKHSDLSDQPVTNRMFRKNVLRIVAIAAIVVVIGVLYLIKNPLGAKSDADQMNAVSGEYASAEFALDATDDFDMDAILSHNLPVMIDFGADACVPCKEMAPMLDELNRELRGRAVIKFVDVWKNPEAGQAVPLQVIPTQFFFNADGSPYVLDNPEAAAQQGFIMYSMRDTGEHVYTAHQGGMDKETMLSILEEMGMQ